MSKESSFLDIAVVYDLQPLNTWYDKRKNNLVTYRIGAHATQSSLKLQQRQSFNPKRLESAT